MKNTLPYSNVKLISLGLKAGAALKLQQKAIGILHNTEAVVTGAVAGFTAAMDDYDLAKSGKRTGYETQATASGNASTLLSFAVDVLTPFLGRTWSQDWVPAGFAKSLVIPSSVPVQLEALRKLEKYLKDNPEQQRPNPAESDKDVTTALAKSVREALAAAVSVVARCKSDVRGKKAARASAKQALQKRLRGLINELTLLIPEDDARWSLFGFNAPGETQAPEAVQGLTLEADGPGRVRAEWPDSARADRYLVEVLIIGQDVEFRRVITVQDNEAVLPLPPGATVKVRVIPANEAGEGVPSASVEIVVPLAQAA